MKKTILAIFPIFLTSLISCHDDSNNLGKDYYYMTKDDALDYGLVSWDFIYKSDKRRSGTFSIIATTPSDVIDYSFDDNYIIAKQKHNREVLLNELKMELSSWGGYYNIYKREGVINFNDVPVSLKEISKQIELRGSTNLADSIISHSSYYKELLTPNKINYYIIDKDEDSILGPFDKLEFEKIKKEKGINLDFKKQIK
jgi:hypothetical protein